MRQVEKIFISRLPLVGSQYTLVTGTDAVNQLREQGLKFIYVDDNGRIKALSPNNKYLDGFYVYKKTVYELDPSN